MIRVTRGQVSLSIVEVGIGLLLVLTITAGFAFGVAPADSTSPQLDAYASDAATILANEQPRHAGQTRLAELTSSPDSFERERDVLAERAGRILPANVMFRVETPHGTVGDPLPSGVETGTATVATEGGDVTIRVWYA